MADKSPHLSANAGQQAPDGPQVPACPLVLVGSCEPIHQNLTIGTRKAFEGGYPFPYTKTLINGETIYVCTKGSQWARTGEQLVLRCVKGDLDCL